MTDAEYMRIALSEARLAAAEGEVPVGAVLLRGGTVLAQAHNRVEQTGDPTAHAELLCLQAAPPKKSVLKAKTPLLFRFFREKRRFLLPEAQPRHQCPRCFRICAITGSSSVEVSST